MALLKYGGGIIDMRGSIAGNVYSRNRYGAYARARTKPVNPNTDRQASIRATMAFLTDAWSTSLSAANRTAWNLYGSNVVMTNKLGESINLSGFNHFIRSNVIRKNTGLGVISAGPVVFEIPEADPTFNVTGSEGTQDLTFTYDDTMDWADENGGWLVLYNGQPQNGQRNFFGGPFRYCSVVEGVNGAPPASPKVTAATFAISEGQRVWVYARIIRADGRMSAPFRADCTIAA